VQSFRLKLSVVNPPPSFQASGRDFLTATHSWLQKKSGRGCHGVVAGAAIIAEFSGVSREEVMPLVDAFIQKQSQRINGIQVVIEDTVAQPLTTEQQAVAISAYRQPTKLTLKYFKSLPAGLFIASNLMSSRHASIFSETIAPAESRMDQWKRIRDCGAAQRACSVFPTEDAFRRWINAPGG
jgi:hypothetical protein